LIKVGKKTIIRNLERKDIDNMMQWGKHDDSIFLHYNFPDLTERERDIWYDVKVKKFGRKCFVVENMKGEIIGYISLRDIKFFRRKSELGIVFDPKVINQGYGTDALCNFLELYFNRLRMKILTLKVAKFNKRAIRCYKKCGFKIINETLEEFQDQDMDEDLKNYIVQNYTDFKLIKGKLMTKYYYMKITKKKFVIHKEKKELLITL